MRKKRTVSMMTVKSLPVRNFWELHLTLRKRVRLKSSIRGVQKRKSKTPMVMSRDEQLLEG